MQMRKNYLPTNKKHQARYYMNAAQECANAGFIEFAKLNQQMAMVLDPPRYDRDSEPE